ncbi:MAG: hypothetical protein II971_03175 [Firmicutes bacterium]|nr:hypothetical protein [Bacillota bacterium]
MDRIRRLGAYQKILLILLAAMVIVFSVLYPLTISREGLMYRRSILVPKEEEGDVVYSGKVGGKKAAFRIHADGSADYVYDGAVYGPYTVRVDASAIPADSAIRDYMTGIELRRGDEVIFRGGLADFGGRYLYSEDGALVGSEFIVRSGDGYTEMGQEGDPEEVGTLAEPTAYELVCLLMGPELTHKGGFTPWLTGTVICAACAVSILYKDEIFRWQMGFRIRGAEKAEASDWEIFGRYVSWTILTIMAAVFYIAGLM